MKKNILIVILILSLAIQAFMLYQTKLEILDKINQIDYIKMQTALLLQNCQ